MSAALRLGFHCGTGTVSTLIRWQTRAGSLCPYSHVSVVLPDGRLLEAYQGEGLKLLRMNGTVRATRTLAQVQAREQVDVATIPMSVAQLHRALAFAHDQLGKGYDYLSVARFVSRRDESRASSGRWFCSEFAFEVAMQGGVALFERTRGWEVAPEMLARSPLLFFGAADPILSVPDTPTLRGV